MTIQIRGVENPTHQDILDFYALVQHRLNSANNTIILQHASMIIPGYYNPHLDFKVRHIISFEIIMANNNMRVLAAKRYCFVNTLGKTSITNDDCWAYDAAGTNNIMPLEDFIPHWQRTLAGGDLKSLIVGIPEPLTLTSVRRKE